MASRHAKPPGYGQKAARVEACAALGRLFFGLTRDQKRDTAEGREDRALVQIHIFAERVVVIHGLIGNQTETEQDEAEHQKEPAHGDTNVELHV